MNRKIKATLSAMILAVCVLVFINACKKDNPSNPTNQNTNQNTNNQQGEKPEVSTMNLDNITENSATVGVYVVDEGDTKVTARGVCWSTATSPTVSDSKTNDGSGTGTFTSTMSGLMPNTRYHVRAYATNSAGTAYGEERSFTTLQAPDTSGKAPCSPQANSVKYNGYTIDYGDAYAGTAGVSVGNYIIDGQAMYSDLSIEFMEVPKSGKYVTSNEMSFMGKGDCSVSGVFGEGAFTFYYAAQAGDTVYVKKLGNDRYSVTFCNLTFSSASAGFSFTTDGNLTTK